MNGIISSASGLFRKGTEPLEDLLLPAQKGLTTEL
jgi:hypothetical protein